MYNLHIYIYLRKAIENSIRSLFHRQLKIVSKDIDLIWDEYQQWESNPSEIKKLEDTYKKTSQSTLNQESFERLFRQVKLICIQLGFIIPGGRLNTNDTLGDAVKYLHEVPR